MASITKRGKTWFVRVSFYDANNERQFANQGGFKTKKRGANVGKQE